LFRLGRVLESDVTGIWSPDFYIQDVWRLRPSLTFTFGVNYGWQTPGSEREGRFALQTNADTGDLITARSYLDTRQQAGEKGQIYNPDFGFVPINDAHRLLFNTDWKALAPRVSLAWNPSGASGITGKLFGNRKTVVRGGFSLLYDRQTTAQGVLIPALGVGFAQTVSANAPPCNSTGPGGSGCDPASGNQAASLFRVGHDGTIPLPVVPKVSNPIVLSWCRTGSASCLFPESFSLVVDPSIKPGKDYAASLSLQRELPWDMLLETAFVGRYARRLPMNVNLEQAPYMQLDPGSGQTFAQAFDRVATALRSGAPVPPQPWFENQVPGGTAPLAATARSNFINGNVNSVFQTLDISRMARGLAPFNNYMAQATAMRAAIGYSNYNGLLVTLRKRL